MRRKPHRTPERSPAARITARGDDARRRTGTQLAGVTDDAVRQFDAGPDERPGHREAAAWGSPPVVEPGD